MFLSDLIHTVMLYFFFQLGYGLFMHKAVLLSNPKNMFLAIESIRIELILQVQLQTQSFSGSCRTVQARTRNTFTAGNLPSME